MSFLHIHAKPLQGLFKVVDMTSDCFTTHESTCADMMKLFGAADTIEQVCWSENKLMMPVRNLGMQKVVIHYGMQL